MIVTSESPLHVLGVDASGRINISARAAEAIAVNGATFDARDKSKPPTTSKEKSAVAKLLKEVHCYPGSQSLAAEVEAGIDRLGAALEELDKNTKNPKIVANKQQSMEELVMALERALSMAKQPSAKADEVISYTREQFENIQNPHRALEQELARLVEAKTPPNSEFYRTRNDRKELAVAFFHRVYGRFYEAGVLYKHQIRAMDFSLYSLLAHEREQLVIPTKKDANDKKLLEISSHQEAWRVARLISRRKKEVA